MRLVFEAINEKSLEKRKKGSDPVFVRSWRNRPGKKTGLTPVGVVDVQLPTKNENGCRHLKRTLLHVFL
jgi:hypothetical protein